MVRITIVSERDSDNTWDPPPLVLTNSIDSTCVVLVLGGPHRELSIDRQALRKALMALDAFAKD